jgi:hypothetical protein
MKMTFSPLIAGLRGRAADAVASSWKGIPYVRKYVIPANPNTPAQQAVRQSFARCIPLWRSLYYVLKLFLDSYGVDYQMSGMNVFVQKNRVLEQADGVLTPMPANPLCPAPSTLAFVTGVGLSGDIDLSWLDNSTEGYGNYYAVARKVGTNVFQGMTSGLADDLSGTISGLEGGVDYDCYAWFANNAEVIMGTSGGELAVTTMA